jgi:tRNA pseudouridine38-40 synthase
LRLGIAYDGREFSGWAKQRDRRTVQGELERILGHLFHQTVELTCAGRTDAGVHARGQVAHFDVPNNDEGIDVGRINRALPDDIRVASIEEVSKDFDARFSALWRRYTYRVCDRPDGPDPLARHMVLEHHKPLDIDKMNEAAQALVGEHDFASFCKLREGATTIREVLELYWERDGNGDAVMTVKADAFCHSMVRSIVGSLIPVGEGRKPITFPKQALRRASRDAGVVVMPGHPLVFEEVGYPLSNQLADRQAVTRMRRDLLEE